MTDYMKARVSNAIAIFIGIWIIVSLISGVVWSITLMSKQSLVTLLTGTIVLIVSAIIAWIISGKVKQ